MAKFGICIHLAQQRSKTDCNIPIPIQKYSMAVNYYILCNVD